jgi:hypothetical protein
MEMTVPETSSHPFGELILSCRRRSPFDWAAAQMRLPAVVAIPLTVLILLLGLGAQLLIASLVATALAMFVEQSIPALAGLTFAPFLAVAMFLLAWFFFILPLKDYCILYEHGFSCRILLTRCRVAFADLQEFRIGQDPKGTEKVFDFINQHVRPGMHEPVRHARSKSLTVTRKNGREIVIEGFLNRFTAEDTTRFLELVDKKYPDLVAVRV